MKIDSKGDLTLTRFNKNVVKSDHRMLTLELNLTFHKEKTHDKTEVFNVRNVECQKTFHEFTSKNNMFTKCFSSQDEDINIQFNRWKRLFDKSIHACFRKTRMNQDDKKIPSRIDELLSKRKIILRKKLLTMEDEEIIEHIEKDITDDLADKEYKKLEKVVGELGSDTNINIWKEMRKAFPKKSRPLPTGVMNFKGKVITNPKEKRKITLEHFEHRMRQRAVKEDTQEIKYINNELFKKRLELAKRKKKSTISNERIAESS